MPRPLAGAGRLLEARIAPPFYRRSQIVTPSEATRDGARRSRLPSPERVTAVDNGVDPFFSPGRSQERHAARRGRRAAWRRSSASSCCWRRRPRHAGTVPDLQVRIIGEGPLPGRARSAGWRLTAPGVGRPARPRQPPEPLRDEYRRAWVVASASLAEGWGLTLTEAAACGTPAVATDIRGHRCSVVDGRTGVLAPPDELGIGAGHGPVRSAVARDRLAAAALARARR